MLRAPPKTCRLRRSWEGSGNLILTLVVFNQTVRNVGVPALVTCRLGSIYLVWRAPSKEASHFRPQAERKTKSLRLLPGLQPLFLSLGGACADRVWHGFALCSPSLLPPGTNYRGWPITPDMEAMGCPPAAPLSPIF